MSWKNKKANQGYWFWKEIIEKCPYCGGEATLGTDALTGKYMVACMNICCGNMKVFYSEYWGKAIVNWNRWTRGVKQ